MIDPTQDGISFINIYTKGVTNLGKQLTNMFQHTFEYNGIQFKSVEHAWHYYKLLSFYPDNVEHILSIDSSFQVKKYAKQFNSEEVKNYVVSAEFQTVIKDVIQQRVMSDYQLKRSLMISLLPFKHFYYYGTVNTGFTVHDESEKYSWLLQIFEDLRDTLRFEYLDNLLSDFGNHCFDKRTASPSAVYVGRGSYFKSITYGNPYPVSAQIKAVKKTNRPLFDKAVAQSVMQFRAYILDKVKRDPVRMYQALVALKDKDLQCFCNNGTNSRATGGGFCHSLVLKSLACNLYTVYSSLRLPIE